MTDHQILFDKLAYIDKLKSAGVSDDAARAHGDALDAALRDSVATKADILNLRNDMKLMARDLTIRMAVIALALFTALVSALSMFTALVSALSIIKYFD